MKRLLLVASLLAVLPAALLTSCGEDEEEGPPIQIQQTDRGRITDMTKSYVAALQQRDMAAARALVVPGVPEATITKSMDTVRHEGFQLVSIGDLTAHGQNVEVLVNLMDKDGKAVTRKLEFRQDKGAWVVYSPHLKPLT